jgi:hypothetical protein
MFKLLAGEPLFMDVEVDADLLMEVIQLGHEIDSRGVAAFKGLPSDLSQARARSCVVCCASTRTRGSLRQKRSGTGGSQTRMPNRRSRGMPDQVQSTDRLI